MVDILDSHVLIVSWRLLPFVHVLCLLLCDDMASCKTACDRRVILYRYIYKKSCLQQEWSIPSTQSMWHIYSSLPNQTAVKFKARISSFFFHRKLWNGIFHPFPNLKQTFLEKQGQGRVAGNNVAKARRLNKMTQSDTRTLSGIANGK